MLVGVVSYSEDPALAGEVAAAGTEIAKMLATDAVVLELDEVSAGLRSASDVVLVKAERDLEAEAESAATAITEAARAKGFRVLLFGETRFGTVVAAKVAARLGVGSLGKGRTLRVEGERLVVTRDVYGGKFLASVGIKMPCIAVVQQGAYAPIDAPPGKVETLSVIAGEARVATVQTKQSQKSALDIRSASVIVSAGRGFGRKEDLALAQGLADALGGALGGSRPLSSDLGWLGEDQHIGLSGAYVHPKLYVAVGISGQLQHVAGIKDSKVVVAINKDAQAPIFQVADYGIVGDLYQVLPVLTRLVEKR